MFVTLPIKVGDNTAPYYFRKDEIVEFGPSRGDVQSTMSQLFTRDGQVWACTLSVDELLPVLGVET